MSKASRNVVLLAKIQPSANTDSVPVAGTNAILCSAPKVNPLNAKIVERNNVMGWMGNSGSVVVATHSTVEFEVEMQGSGAAGAAPAFAPLLRGCAIAETLVAVTSASYAPVTSGHEALSLYYFLDGIKHIITDAKGTVSIGFDAEGIPVYKFKFWGFHSTPSDVTMPTGVVYTGFKDPLPVNKANTTTFTLHGVVIKPQSLSLDLGNQVEYSNRPNAESIVITNRKPTGSITFEMDLVATKDWWAVVKNGTLGALAITHGATAGYISSLAAPKIGLTNLDYTDAQGVAMFSASLNVQPNAGNDEIVQTFT